MPLYSSKLFEKNEKQFEVEILMDCGIRKATDEILQEAEKSFNRDYVLS